MRQSRRASVAGVGVSTVETTDPTWVSQAWDLTGLLPDSSSEGVSSKLEAVAASVERFESHRPDLDSIDSVGLLDLVAEYEAIASQMQVLAAYGSLWFASDTQSEKALAFRNRVEQELTALQNRTLFFTLWWKGLSDAEVKGLLAQVDADSDASFFLAEQRRFREYTLEEASEQIVNLKDADGIGGLLTVYSMLTNRLEYELEINGEKQCLTRDQLMGHVMSPDADLRQAAYTEFYRVFANEAKVLGQIYVHRVRDWHNENVGLRHYSSALAVRNVSNDIPEIATECLLQTARTNAGLFQRYFRLKASWLGQSTLRRCDLYAPLSLSQEEVDYSDAVNSVLDIFGDFDESFASEAAKVFLEERVDSEIRSGKKSGAFCATVLPEMTPWVLVNYSGRLRDVATLAHELGHAVHSLLARDHSILTQHASLPLAETASVFAEMLMMDRLLEQQSEATGRRELLASALDDIYATVLRQSYFVLFEIEAHKAILESCSLDDLQEIYLQNLAEQFGDSVEVPPEFRFEWVSIPHLFSTPFYCYAYAFGQLLVLALYRRYRQDPEGFKPGYLKLLAYGGSARPEVILAEAGVDISDPAFWQGGFDLVGELIDQLEELDV